MNFEGKFIYEFSTIIHDRYLIPNILTYTKIHSYKVFSFPFLYYFDHFYCIRIQNHSVYAIGKPIKKLKKTKNVSFQKTYHTIFKNRLLNFEKTNGNVASSRNGMTMARLSYLLTSWMTQFTINCLITKFIHEACWIMKIARSNAFISR